MARMLQFTRLTSIPKQKGMNMRTKLTIITLGLLLATLPAAADFETGLSHFKAGKYMEAAAEFQKLVDENPDYADGYHLEGADSRALGAALRAPVAAMLAL